MSVSVRDGVYDRERTLGKLKLKGEKKTKKKKKKTKRSRDDEEEAPAELPVVTLPGSGRIVSSGETIQGFETKFKGEAAVGDCIMVHHPTSTVIESRVITGILSERSLRIDVGFSNDLVSTIGYHIRKDSIALQRKAELKVLQQGKKQKVGEEGAAVDTDQNDEKSEEVEKLIQDEVSRKLQKQLKKAKKTVAVREKTGMWGYKMVNKTVGKEHTAEDMLDIRAKQGRDKYCW